MPNATTKPATGVTHSTHWPIATLANALRAPVRATRGGELGGEIGRKQKSSHSVLPVHMTYLQFPARAGTRLPRWTCEDCTSNAVDVDPVR